MFAERPELEGQFDGFTFYPNTLSHGGHTDFGSPGLYGGYEYVPSEMDRRSDESLVSKQNEALRLMPALFSGAGFRTTVINPPYANYQWIPDVSIYDGMQGVEAYALQDAYTEIAREKYGIDEPRDMYRTFVFWSLMKGMAEALQDVWYQDGRYLTVRHYSDVQNSLITEYASLDMLPDITDASSDESGFLLIGNGVPHEADELQMPDYTLAMEVDNSSFDDPTAVKLEGCWEMASDERARESYHVNAAMYLRLGAWFDWLREQGVYDNSRVIVVADHGSASHLFESMEFEGGPNVCMFNPLLMVKDFDAHGFATDDTFMTNADTPTLAIEGLIDNPTNPFTGNPVNSDEKTGHPQLVTASMHWRLGQQNATTFDTSDAPWYSVHSNVFDANNWTKVKEAEE